MVNVISYNEYLKKILSQILDSYNILRRIQDKPGDLDNINKEMLKINGFIKVVTNNIDEKKIPLNDLISPGSQQPICLHCEVSCFYTWFGQ